MDVAGSVAIVTGANRGLGAAFCRGLLERGATKVYAGARDVNSVSMDGVIPVQLDRAAQECTGKNAPGRTCARD